MSSAPYIWSDDDFDELERAYEEECAMWEKIKNEDMDLDVQVSNTPDTPTEKEEKK